MLRVTFIALVLIKHITASDLGNCSIRRSNSCNPVNLPKVFRNRWIFKSDVVAKCPKSNIVVPLRAVKNGLAFPGKSEVMIKTFLFDAQNCSYQNNSYDFFKIKKLITCMNYNVFEDLLVNNSLLYEQVLDNLTAQRNVSVADAYKILVDTKKITNSTLHPHYSVFWMTDNYPGLCKNIKLDKLNSCMYNYILLELGVNYTFGKPNTPCLLTEVVTKTKNGSNIMLAVVIVMLMIVLCICIVLSVSCFVGYRNRAKFSPQKAAKMHRRFSYNA